MFGCLVTQFPAKLFHLVQADFVNTTRASIAQEFFAIAGTKLKRGDQVGVLFAGKADPKLFSSHDRQLKNVVIIAADRNIVAGCHVDRSEERRVGKEWRSRW